MTTIEILDELLKSCEPESSAWHGLSIVRLRWVMRDQKIQEAVEEIMAFAAKHGISYERDDIEECAQIVGRHTGVTPTEVTP